VLCGSSNPADTCVAFVNGDSLVINGDKRFITGCPEYDTYVTFVRLDDVAGVKGIGAVVVEKDLPADPDEAAAAYATATMEALGGRVMAVCARGSTDALRSALKGLRPAAALTLEAHLDKLEREGRLPAGFRRAAG